MPAKKQDAYRALELMEMYLRNLEDRPGTEELQEALSKAIVAIRSRLFQALLDIQEFYEYTLDNAAKSLEVKAEETRQLVEKWDGQNPPVPVETRRLAQQTIAPTNERMNGSFDESSEKSSPYKSPYKEDTPPIQPETVPENIREETIVIERDLSSGLGLSIAGGTDNPHAVGEYGIFITKLTTDSPAEMCGLIQLGDQILSVNDVSLQDVTHADAVNALKSAGTRVEIRIRRFLDRVWSPASTNDMLDTPGDRSPAPVSTGHIVEVTLHKKGGGLGLSIAGGTNNQHVEGDNGIFITNIIANGVAEEDGRLGVNDRIIEVNDKTMVNVTHEEAVEILKGTGKDVYIKVEKNAINPEETHTKDEDEELINKPRIVSLDRGDGKGLGFNIIGGEEEVGIFISVISDDGIAAKSGQLKIGDMILEVNGENLERWSHDTAAHALKTAGDHVTLKVIYKPKEFDELYRRMQLEAEIRQLYVRALFDYDASKDTDRPGEGLSFNHGDILHILNGNDEEWWQAAAVGQMAEDGQQGLIPSKRRLERRARAINKSVKFGETEDRRGSSSMSAKLRSSFKKLPFGKKGSTPPTVSEESDVPQDDEQVSTYEPVSLTKRRYARPVIVLGPLKEDINDRLVRDFPDKFAGCVPHTTRKARSGEVDGRDYHFVATVDEMERDIQAHLFIEAGRYKDNLYGTSIQAVRQVAEEFKHCILGVSGYAIRRLNMADLSPIAICIAPSSPDVINVAEPRISEEQAEEMFKKGRAIQTDFADSFTAKVEGDSIDDIYEKVKNVIMENSGEFMWIPSNEQL